MDYAQLIIASGCSGEAVVPGARKPSNGSGSESRQLSPLQLLISTVLPNNCHHVVSDVTKTLPATWHPTVLREQVKSLSGTIKEVYDY